MPPLPSGRFYNHYRDINNDGDFADANDLNGDGDTDDIVGGVAENEDLDRDGDCVINWEDPDPGNANSVGVDLENLALNKELDVEHADASDDWGNPGKQHAMANDSLD